MKKILITGGAGYVGAALTPYLISKGYQVTVLDLMIYGKEVLKDDKNLKIITGDIRDTQLLKKVLVDIDVVIHLACISNDPSFELNPNLGKSINLDAFEPLVKISKDNKVKKFIYASSSSVYGVKEVANVNEQMKLEPLTDYSKFKADCEKILLKYNSENFVTTVVRPATVCGYSPRQRLDVVVNIFTNLAFNKRKISIFGGSQLRPNIHIFDMIRVYEKILTAPSSKISGEIFNAGYHNHSVKELGQIVKKEIGNDVELEFVKSSDNRSYHISSEKINKVIGFETTKKIEDAVIDLKKAFEDGLLPNSMEDEKYFNIRRMNNLKLR